MTKCRLFRHETWKGASQEHNMSAKIVVFSFHGDTTLLEYDPATVDMEEVNRVVAEYGARTGARPFDMATGKRIERVTSEHSEVLVLHAFAGG